MAPGSVVHPRLRVCFCRFRLALFPSAQRRVACWKGENQAQSSVTPEISVLERIMLKWSGGPCIKGQGQAAIAGLPSCSAGKASFIMHNFYAKCFSHQALFVVFQKAWHKRRCGFGGFKGRHPLPLFMCGYIAMLRNAGPALFQSLVLQV